MSDYETTQKKRNMTVGIFVVAAVCFLVWLIFMFGDLPIFVSRWKSYKVVVQFPSAPGVQENTPVRFCGYHVGRVTEMRKPKVMPEIGSDRVYHQTIIILSIDKEYNDIPSNVEVKLMTRGLGSSYIELKVPLAEVMKRPTEFLVDMAVLQGSTGMTSEFFPEESQKKLDELANQLRDLLNNANEILGDKENKKNIRKSLANLSEATAQVGRTLEGLKKFSASAVSASEELSKTAAQLRLILEKINNGQGTAGKLINDGRFYENMLENSQQLQLLLEDLVLFMAEVNDKGLRLKW